MIMGRYRRRISQWAVEIPLSLKHMTRGLARAGWVCANHALEISQAFHSCESLGVRPTKEVFADLTRNTTKFCS